MGVTEKLANFIFITEYDGLPTKATEIAKTCIMDCLGVAVAASAEKIAGNIAGFVKTMGGLPSSTVVGSTLKAPAVWAALANGTLAHALDYDDISWNFYGHPSVTIVPAILSLGEALGSSGKDIISAYLVGLEVEGKLGQCLNPDVYSKGWHTTSVVGTLGAAAACAKLLKLHPGEVQSALGIASSEACGLMQNFGTMTKPLHAGLAAKNGVIAAKLAKQGITASRDIIEADMGFCRVFSGNNKYSLKAMEERLGTPFEAISPGIVFKQYPSCGGTHPAIDAILFLRKEHSILPEHIDRIECGMDVRRREVLFYEHPQNALQGKFSIQFSLAVAMLEGRVGLKQVTDEKVNDTKIKAMMEKVQVFVHPDLQTQESLKKRFMDVTVIMKDGAKLQKRVYKAKGDPEIPLSSGEFSEKFRDCASVALPKGRIDQCIEKLNNLESLNNIRDLMKLLLLRET